MKRIKWTEQLATGFDDIDEQHRHLLGVLDSLAQRTETGAALRTDELESVVVELGEYARHHFDAEVRMMLESCCDLRHMQKHVREHEGFVRHISLVREAIDDSRCDEGTELARYLGEWFTRHIAGSDCSMGRQIRRIRAGQSPEAAYLAEQPAMAA